MFPDSHPYGHTVIGSHEDLEAATVDDVKNFFATYYVPSNASLVVAGDFDPQVIKPLIAELFGKLPRGSDVVHRTAGPVRLGEVKRLTMTDNVQYARSDFVYHSPGFYAEGDAEMDLVAAILTDGISSRLYRRLITEDKLALDVSAYQESRMLGSLFHVQATARAGVDLERLEQTMDEVIAEFLEQGPTADELAKQQAQLEYSAISQLQSLLGKADRLNAYQFYFGEPGSFERDMDRYRNATADSVKRWATEVLTPGERLVLRVIPELKHPEPSPLDGRPTATAAAGFELPKPETFQLKNGIEVHHWKRQELPMIALSMVLPVGSAADPADRAGLTALAVEMLDEGAGGRDASAFSDALDLLGARFSAAAGRQSVTVGLSSLTGSFDDALALYADAIRRPSFEPKEWERVHTLHVEELKREADRPGSVARVVGLRAYFGDDHPYGRPGRGTPDSAGTIELVEARERYERLFRPEGAVILAAGDIEAKALKRKLDASLGDWRAPRGARPLDQPSYPEPASKDFRVVVVDRPDAVQTVVRFMMPGPLYTDAQRWDYQLFGTILGGSFTSRLNQNLREEHGYTYGASCAYSMHRSVGYFVASSRVRADVTGASIAEFMKEFQAIRGGDVSEEEAGKARSSERLDMIRSFAGLNGILSAASTLIENGRPLSDLDHDLSRVARITERDLNGIAQHAIPLETGLLVLVGDTTSILSQIKGLGLPRPIELTVTGDPVIAAGAGSRAGD
jgi:predicted Zn-dependent peptidase